MFASVDTDDEIMGLAWGCERIVTRVEKVGKGGENWAGIQTGET
jgi:hypothetical protein